ncbi:ParB/RepB/Spo0J family partition protein [Myxococcota bacterium]
MTNTGVLPPPPEGGELAVQEIALELILDSPYQLRQWPLSKKDVSELMHSISANGQTAPIIVSPAGGQEEGKYHVHSGHRRCAALRFLGAKTVNAIVRSDLDERAARRLALADNLGREDLTAFEQALALRDYCESYKLKVEEAAKELGLKRSHAFRLNAVLSASEDMVQLFKDEAVSARGAELLSKLEQRDARKAHRLARKFVGGRASLRVLEDELRKSSNKGASDARLRKDIELKADQRTVTLNISLVRDECTDAQLKRMIAAIAQLLGELGIAEVQAAPKRSRGSEEAA